jgi:hypothetical protein
MKNIRNYLRALESYEKVNDCFVLLCDYFTEKKSNLSKLYCSGQVYLPSFMMLKKIHFEYMEYSMEDPELNKLFNSSIHCSKLFYSKLAKLIIDSENSNNDFEKQFELRIQPLGQQLVNLITNIKYRIKFIESERTPKKKAKLVTLVKNIYVVGKIIYGFFSNIMYKMTVIRSTRPTFAKGLYYTLITAIIILFWAINFLLFRHLIPPIASAFLNVVSGILVIVIAIITYPIGDFGKIDISGKNIVAYKYKLFFNNHTNLRMLHVFTIDNSVIPRQSANSKVES